MITIALDERGIFEGGISRIGMIAGFEYDDRGIPGETDREKTRLREYLKKVCEAAGTEYPRDLHRSNHVDNSEQEDLTKRVFCDTVGEFFKNGGFFAAPGTPHMTAVPSNARKGRYRLFVKMRSRKGVTSKLGTDVNFLLRDTSGANRYIHMAEETVIRLMFHDPEITPGSSFSLQLPTRLLVISDGSDGGTARKNEMRNLGYRPFVPETQEAPDEKVRYQIANADVYRMAIEREADRTLRTDLKVEEFRVKTIEYEWLRSLQDIAAETDQEKKNSLMDDLARDQKRESFMHLADGICSWIAEQIDDEGRGRDLDPKEAAPLLKEKMDQLIGYSTSLVFAYDDVDVMYTRAWEQYEQKDLYSSLNTMFDAVRSSSEMVDFYRDTWFRDLEDRIEKNNDIEAFATAARRFQSDLYRNNLNQEKTVYCCRILEKSAERLKDDRRASDACYSFFEAGMSAYNHVGDSAGADRCFSRLSEVAGRVGTEQYLRALNRRVVTLCDMGRLEEALELAGQCISNQEEVGAVRMMILGEDTTQLEVARARSQRGQVLAFMNDLRAEKDFHDAMELFEDGSADQLITISYLLHFYAESGDKEKYERYAERYFGTSDREEQLRFLLEKCAARDSVISMKFGIFVYMKAAWLFYRDGISSLLRELLREFDKTVRKFDPAAAGEVNGHPWEITFKYMALLSRHAGLTRQSADFMERASAAVTNPGAIIERIAEQGRMEFEEGEIRRGDGALTYMYH